MSQKQSLFIMKDQLVPPGERSQNTDNLYKNSVQNYRGYITYTQTIVE